MAVSRSFSVTATGVVLDPQTGVGFFALTPDSTDFFIGIGGSYTGLTLQIQGSRGGNYYDLGSFTTDGVGPLVTPLSPADGAEIAYVGDCRAFTQLQLTILSLTTGPVAVEVLAGSFFPQRPGMSLSGGQAQLVYEIRALRSVLSSWLGPPSGPLPNLPSSLIGTGVGGSFPN